MLNIVFVFFLVTGIYFENVTNGLPIEGSFTDLSEYFSQRIVGGVDAPSGFAPYMAALIIGDRFQSITCGGSILTERNILTAAHCIDAVLNDGMLASSLSARVGSNQWNSGGHLLKFQSYTNHPMWDPTNIKNDVGVLGLKSEIQLSEKVGVVALSYDWVDGGQSAFATGWGWMGPTVDGDVLHMAPTPDNLQLLYMDIITPQQCIDGMRAAALKNGECAPEIHPEVEICTYHSVKHGMCSGDSGSALMTLKEKKQVGVVSWGFACALGAPDVFARISGMQDFLIPYFIQSS